MQHPRGKAGISFVVAARVLGLRDMGVCLSPTNSFLISTGAPFPRDARRKTKPHIV